MLIVYFFKISLSNYSSGILNFCSVALALHDQGYRPVGIRIDSGDLAYLSQLARSMFEKVASHYQLEWFSKLTIVASNDINEETILSLNEQGHKIDVFGIGTHLVTCQKQPALGCVYKLVEVNDQPRIKLRWVVWVCKLACTFRVSCEYFLRLFDSQDVEKVTMPGRKKAYRLYGEAGLLADLISVW